METKGAKKVTKKVLIFPGRKMNGGSDAVPAWCVPAEFTSLYPVVGHRPSQRKGSQEGEPTSKQAFPLQSESESSWWRDYYYCDCSTPTLISVTYCYCYCYCDCSAVAEPRPSALPAPWPRSFCVTSFKLSLLLLVFLRLVSLHSTPQRQKPS